MKLEIKGLNFAYDKSKLVLKNVSFSLDQGDILAVIGPNGSGKSTLLKCINNILSPNEGDISLDGKKIEKYSMRDLSKKIGYVPQIEQRGFPSTVFDTILMGRKPYISWEPSSKDLKIVSDIIERLDLKDLSMREINQLSGGQRQKVFVARALAQQPDILLLDEPTSNLDLKHQLEVLDIIKKEVENGRSAIIAIHDLNMAVRYSDNLVMLKEGKVFASGGLEVINSKNIESVYDVKVHVGEHAGWPIVTPDSPIKS